MSEAFSDALGSAFSQKQSSDNPPRDVDPPVPGLDMQIIGALQTKAAKSSRSI
jgi:hypothetical protein